MGTAKDRVSVSFALGERNVPESFEQLVKSRISAVSGQGHSLRPETQTSEATTSFDKFQFLNLSHHSIDQAISWDKSAKKQPNKRVNQTKNNPN